MNHENEISLSVRRALLMGAAVAAGSTVSLPRCGARRTRTAQADETVDTVVVTGSRIRRVDAETANPVFVIDSAAIAASGVSTIGDLVQQIPAISGAATNPQVNNGGGNGDSNIELRGLDPARTLVLLNGRRIGVLGLDTGARRREHHSAEPHRASGRPEGRRRRDLRLRRHRRRGELHHQAGLHGTRINLQYGQTDRSDGDRQEAEVTFGINGDSGNLVAGGRFNRQDEVRRAIAPSPSTRRTSTAPSSMAARAAT